MSSAAKASPSSAYDEGRAILARQEADGCTRTAAIEALGIDLTRGLRAARIASLPEAVLSCWSDRTRISLRGGAAIAAILEQGGEPAARLRRKAIDIVLLGRLPQPERLLLRAAQSWKRDHRQDMKVRQLGADGKGTGDVIGRVRIMGDRGVEIRLTELKSSDQLGDVLRKLREAGLHID